MQYLVSLLSCLVQLAASIGVPLLSLWLDEQTDRLDWQHCLLQDFLMWVDLVAACILTGDADGEVDMSCHRL